MISLFGAGRFPQEGLNQLAGDTSVYNRDHVPSSHSTPLAFFKKLPTPLTAPDLRAGALREARCEITSDRIHNPVQLVLGGGVVVLQGVGGYKERDPTLEILPTDPRLITDKCKAHNVIKTGHIDIACQLAVDGERQLVWTADEKRIKSHHFNFPKPKSQPARKGKKRRRVSASTSNSQHPSFIARHTFKSDTNSSQYRGPIALVSNGAKLLRCGRQGVAIWDVDSAPTHGEDGKEIIGEEIDPSDLLEDSCRNYEDFMGDVEGSSGSPRNSRLKFDAPLGQLNITGWTNDPSNRNKAMIVYTGDDDLDYSVFGLDLVTGKRQNRYLGHGGSVSQISTLSQNNNAFLSSCGDGAARLYDVRLSTPVMTMSTTEENLDSSVLVSSGGGLYAFVGGTRSQSIKLWDLRAHCAVYELSVGNNSVSSLGWDEEHQTLYAATECEALDRVGYHNNYRWAKAPSWEEDQWDGEDEEKGWPDNARHDEESFGVVFDAGRHSLFRYAFKDSADVSILPAYGDGIPRSEGRYGMFW
ncbi:hypothetical protein DL93DRAFT_2083107 [Clavulina sp. PMI_390]|nr:hypothetical protein DL93DRAFT_2083107 [Clavulina sp. PMI_390]